MCSSNRLARRRQFGSVFVLNPPVAALAMWFLVRHVPRCVPRAERFDPLGQVLAASGVGLVVAALVESSTMGWDVAVLTIVATGVVLLGAFWGVEHRLERHGRHPMLAPSLLSGAPMRAGLAAAAIYNFGLYGMLIVFSVVLQQQRHDSGLEAGLAFLPLTIVGAATSAVLAGPPGRSTSAAHRAQLRHGASSCGLGDLGLIWSALALLECRSRLCRLRGRNRAVSSRDDHSGAQRGRGRPREQGQRRTQRCTPTRWRRGSRPPWISCRSATRSAAHGDGRHCCRLRSVGNRCTALGLMKCCGGQPRARDLLTPKPIDQGRQGAHGSLALRLTF